MTDNTQVGLKRWCEAFIDGDISAGQFKRAVRTWHNKRELEAMIDTLEYAKISPKFKIEEKIEQLRLELKKYE